MGAKISKIEYYLPNNILTNSELTNKFPDWTPEMIENKVGVRERHIVDNDQTSLDLAVKVSEKILSEENKNEIDFLILCTQSPDYFLPTSACILQNKLGLSCDIGAFDFNLGCSGYIFGLSIAKGLIYSGTATKILLVTSETYSKFIHQDDKGNRTIFGDGASASIIEFSENNCIQNFVLGTDGSGFGNLIVRNGGLRNSYMRGKINSDSDFIPSLDDDYLYMNGPEIFNFTIQKIPALVKDTLAKNNLNMDDVDYFVFHQANKYILEYLRKKIKIPEDKFYNNLLFTGNTVSSTIPIAICNLIADKKIKTGDTLLLAGFGVGLSWGATIIKI